MFERIPQAKNCENEEDGFAKKKSSLLLFLRLGTSETSVKLRHSRNTQIDLHNSIRWINFNNNNTNNLIWIDILR